MPFRVTAYDRVASGIVAGLILIGGAVTLMFIIWLTNRLAAGSQAAVPVVMEELGTGDEGPVGGGQELERPAEEDLVEEVTINEPDLTDTLSQVSMVITQNPDMTKPVGEYSDTGEGGGRGGGKGTGQGPGRGGRMRRWELVFPQGTSLEAYARILDYFGIELGVLLPGNRVEYASHLVQPKPDRRTGPADQESRYYLTWSQGELVEADRELLQRAGIAAGDHLILKFLPPQVEQTLAGLERTKAGTRLNNVRGTRFAIEPAGRDYSLHVIEQTYR